MWGAPWYGCDGQRRFSIIMLDVILGSSSLYSFFLSQRRFPATCRMASLGSSTLSTVCNVGFATLGVGFVATIVMASLSWYVVNAACFVGVETLYVVFQWHVECHPSAHLRKMRMLCQRRDVFPVSCRVLSLGSSVLNAAWYVVATLGVSFLISCHARWIWCYIGVPTTGVVS
jgi:hypothetical protein